MAIENRKDYGHSAKAKLLNLAMNSNNRYQLLLTRYFQERLLYRLSISRYKRNFVLKGGALLYAHHGLSARPTLDIDFMGDHIDRQEQTLVNAFREICGLPYPQDGVIFKTETITTSPIAIDKKYPGVNISMDAMLHSIQQRISLDIGFGDIVTPRPVQLDYPTLLDPSASISVAAYSIETVVAEKFQTVIERGTANSRMKDFYDLYVILSNGEYNEDVLHEAIEQTFSNRHTKYDEDTQFFRKAFTEDDGLNRRWKAYMRKLKPAEYLEFPAVVYAIRNCLKPYWERLKQ